MIEEEIWKVIPGHSRYEASTLGRIRDLKDGEIKNPLLNGGFWCFNITDDQGKKYLGKVHRLVAATFLPNPDNHNRVQHRGSRDDNSVSNIEWLVLKPKPEKVERVIEYVKWKGISFDKELFADMCNLKVWQLNKKLVDHSPAEIALNFKAYKGVGYQDSTHWFPSRVLFERAQAERCLVEKRQAKLKRNAENSKRREEAKAKSHFGFGVFVNYPVKGIVGREALKSYNVWAGMIARCYNPEHDSYERYGGRGCTVNIKWKYYQDFVIWYDAQQKSPMCTNWHIDKDILFDGNLEYGPDTCVLVPNDVNVFFTTIGESVKGYVLHKKLYRASITIGGVKSQRSFLSESEALDWYKKGKTLAAQTLLWKYEGLLDERVVHKLSEV